jgi:hypothetical protein
MNRRAGRASPELRKDVAARRSSCKHKDIFISATQRERVGAEALGVARFAIKR